MRCRAASTFRSQGVSATAANRDRERRTVAAMRHDEKTSDADRDLEHRVQPDGLCDPRMYRATRPFPSVRPPMNAASTRLALHTLLPSDRPASRNHRVSNVSPATPDTKKIGTSLFCIRPLCPVPVGGNELVHVLTPYNARMAIPDDDVHACVRVLRAIEADRSHLTRLTQEQRRELLTLAGLVAKPERHDLVRMAKAFRRAEREAAKEHDRKAIEQAGLRVQRRAAVYAPLWLEPPKPEDLDERPRAPSGARLLRLQEALREGASLLRLDVRAVRRLQLRQARADGGSQRALRAGHRRAGEDRLPGVAQTAARRRARRRHHALSRRRRGAVFARSRTSPRSASGCRFTGSTCGTRRASSCSRGSCSSGCRGSTTSSTTRARPCAVRRASSSTCWRAKPSRSPRFPSALRSPLASHDELRRTLDGAHARTAAGTLVAAAGARARRRPAAQRGALAAALSRRRLSRRRGAVPRGPLRRGPAAGRPARDEQLAAAHARSRDARAARSAARERHRAVHPQRAPEAADGAHAGRVTSTSST